MTMKTKMLINPDWSEFIDEKLSPDYREQIVLTRRSFKNEDDGFKRLESERVRFRREGRDKGGFKHGTSRATLVEAIEGTLEESITMYINSEYICNIGGVMDEVKRDLKFILYSLVEVLKLFYFNNIKFY